VLARLARKRFVVVSVGVGTLDRRLSRRFVRLALRLASYRSYRDEGSKALLRDMDFTRGDPCVPDLAFGLEWSPPASPPDRSDVLRIGVSPIGFGHPAHWPTKDPTVFERYIGELTAFVRWLGDNGYQVVLFASSGVDRLIVAEMEQALRSERAGAAPTWLSRASDETLPGLLAELAQLHIVVASRLHGVVLSQRVGTPVLAISFDRKVDEHLSAVGMTRYRLDIKSVDRGSLLEAFQLLLRNQSSVRATLQEAFFKGGREVAAQFDLLARLPAGTGRAA
jgi:polysaccharide pyruvyl transferase WcaK-like protein